MFGSLAAMGFAQLTGLILQTSGSYWPLFIIAGSAYLLALAIVQALVPGMKPAELTPVST
jgi:ACS family hexuronate transporter-like MFS transporter